MNKFLFLLLISSLQIFGQDINVLHYKYSLTVNDRSDTIIGVAQIKLTIVRPVSEIRLDFQKKLPSGKGMFVEKVTGSVVQGFRQENESLFINIKNVDINKEFLIEISYSGIPDDGLIISKNKFHDRTFFADNWPNRAHHWIPCNDRPDDKASFEFIVMAPDHYKVISNGILTEETLLPQNMKRTHWSEPVSLPTKVMVIGVASFAIKEYIDKKINIPVSAWIYPQDSLKGFYDYGVAPGIIEFYESYIGPFPYNKLANVQSKTIFGGMENASCIFYAEASVTGDRSWEDVLAHEIAHQWFGDMASEKTFAHLWLSEGFATYLTDIYMQHKYGIDSAKKRLVLEREKVIHFVHSSNHPVVDTSRNLMFLLNANSYEKGSWFLHMLHAKLGDKIFLKIIQTYYQQYKGSNADSRDFERVVEKICGYSLKPFFDQWLYTPGVPNIQTEWTTMGKNVEIIISQKTDFLFSFPLEIKIELENGSSVIEKIDIKQKNQKCSFNFQSKVSNIILDPLINLLFEGSITKK